MSRELLPFAQGVLGTATSNKFQRYHGSFHGPSQWRFLGTKVQTGNRVSGSCLHLRRIDKMWMKCSEQKQLDHNLFAIIGFGFASGSMIAITFAIQECDSENNEGWSRIPDIVKHFSRHGLSGICFGDIFEYHCFTRFHSRASLFLLSTFL